MFFPKITRKNWKQCHLTVRITLPIKKFFLLQIFLSCRIILRCVNFIFRHFLCRVVTRKQSDPFTFKLDNVFETGMQVFYIEVFTRIKDSFLIDYIGLPLSRHIVAEAS